MMENRNMSMDNIFRVGGVPEHFNLPWHLAIENKAFQEHGLAVEWQDFPGGTGAMTEALDNGELDIAISLTEGIVNKIIQGGNFRILQNFVESPLNWGVYVSADAPYYKPEDLEDKRFAISRMGSGSHLMAFVYAQQNNWSLNDDQLIIASNLSGMVKALNNKESDILLWEKYTTQPYVDNGQLKILDETAPHWPAFAMAASNHLVKNQPEALNTVQKVINQTNADFMADQDSVYALAKRYDMSIKDAQQWFKQTRWSVDNKVNKGTLEGVVQTLNELGLVDTVMEADKLCSHLTALEQGA